MQLRSRHFQTKFFLPLVLSFFAFEAASLQDQISAGYGHTCLLRQSENQVYCWGWNYHGEVGDGSFHSPFGPHRVSLPEGRVIQIEAGGSSTCAIIDSKLYCWGANTLAQIGYPVLEDQTRPVLIEFPGPVSHVAVGSRHSCAVVEGGVFCWGFNFDCQGGFSPCVGGVNNPRRFVLAPTPVTHLPKGSGVEKVAVGRQNTCVLRDRGVACWGAGFHGGFGDGKGEVVYRAEPQWIPGHGPGSGVREIAVGDQHICANRNGMIRCWGVESYLATGRATVQILPPRAPSNIAGSPWESLSTHDSTTCAIFRGSASCWGLGINGALGVGFDLDLATRMENVRGLRDLVTLTTGAGHSCALNRSGEVYCWGWNALCQMADGTCYDGRASVFSPERIRF